MCHDSSLSVQLKKFLKSIGNNSLTMWRLMLLPLIFDSVTLFHKAAINKSCGLLDVFRELRFYKTRW